MRLVPAVSLAEQEPLIKRLDRFIGADRRCRLLRRKGFNAEPGFVEILQARFMLPLPEIYKR